MAYNLVQYILNLVFISAIFLTSGHHMLELRVVSAIGEFQCTEYFKLAFLCG